MHISREHETSVSGTGMTDTHAHICDSSFDDDRKAILERAEASGIEAIIAVGENIEDAHLNLQLSRDFPIIKPAAGLYPAHLDVDAAEEMAAFVQIHHHRLWAIGEVGLDFWVVKEEEQRELQKEIFAGFIRLSLELDLPLNVHSRSAGRHAVDGLLENGAKKVQMHAFDGKAAYAMAAVEAGYFFSIPPSVVRSRQKQKLVKNLPLECLLVETDSPVLGPDPKVRNEPANLSMVACAVADIKELPLEAVKEVIKENTRQLYNSQENAVTSQ